jgi:DNA-binding MarR family transcriptional regulator
VLNVCEAGEGTTEGLAEELRIERAAVLRCTDHLMKAGMLQRAGHAEETRYSQFVLTDKGRKILPKLRAVSRRMSRHFLAEFSEEQRAQLLSLLSALAESKPFRRASSRHLLAKAGCPNCPVRHIYS